MANSNSLEYQMTLEDLERCFKFSRGYYLASGKGSINRTTGQYRGFGGVIDSFFIGKLIEIGVASIIEKFTDKKILLDFDIHEATDDPDIVEVGENKAKRKPKLYVEIKNTSPDDRWVGLTAEQFNTILKNDLVKNNPNKIFIVGASLFSKSSKDIDPLGVFLKAKLKEEQMEKFADASDLVVKIQYILRGDELKNKGTAFNEGSFMYETEIFQELDDRVSQKILDPSNRPAFKIINAKGKALPIIMRDKRPEPKEFGKFVYDGNLVVYKKENPKSDRMYVHCKTDVVVDNNVLGKFELKKAKTYECFFTTIGWNPTLKRNNIWIAQRNLKNIVGVDTATRIKEIAEGI